MFGLYVYKSHPHCIDHVLTTYTCSSLFMHYMIALTFFIDLCHNIKEKKKSNSGDIKRGNW